MIVINGEESETEKTNIISQPTFETTDFYYSKDFEYNINQIMTYMLNIALEKYFSNVLQFDLTRIIYASNDYNIRERTRKNNGELNIPFMNYYLRGYSHSDRLWFNNYANLYYPFGSEQSVNLLGSTFRITPIKMEYEGTIFFSQHQDCEYSFKNLKFEQSNETIIKYSLPVGEDEILNNGIFNIDLEFNATYQDSDWLEQNKIYTIGLDFNIDTYILKGNSNKSYICNKVILDFITAKIGSNLKNLKENDIINIITTYFEGE